ncbi:MAG TPA: FAD-dependent oxidoreductase [Planctomycetota bacterium]|nr:FAD-dependent oxidoreductase [Planctomycetota bacterium]
MNQRDRVSRREAIGLAAGAAGAALASSRAIGATMDTAKGTLAFQRELLLAKPCDVVVCGGGPAGFAAALAARRAGLSVLLVDAQGQLGGMGTSGLVSHWLGGRTSDCRRWVVGGVFRTLAEEAAKRGIALLPTPAKTKYQPHGWFKGQLEAGVPFDPFGMAGLLDEKAAEAGVEVLLLTQAVDVAVADGRITHVVISNKSGLAAVPAAAVVDATGDADIAARSGCEIVKGREGDALMTPATLIFHVDGVDQDALAAYIGEHDTPRFRKEIAALRKAGEWPFPYDIFISVQLTEKGTMMINTSRLVGVDGTDGASVTQGMIRGRAETQKLLAILRKHFPGFANARVKAVAPLLGVRETRRIKGPYVLTVKDVNAGRGFDEAIGFSAYGWDLPDPKRPSENPGHGKLPGVTPILYRVMVPQPLRNLICPGRAVSVERPVLGPLRVTAPCMAMGEAAGAAAEQVVRRGIAFAEVNVPKLRKTLSDHGAVVEWNK